MKYEENIERKKTHSTILSLLRTLRYTCGATVVASKLMPTDLTLIDTIWRSLLFESLCRLMASTAKSGLAYGIHASNTTSMASPLLRDVALEGEVRLYTGVFDEVYIYENKIKYWIIIVR
jgi:hypothetical protein